MIIVLPYVELCIRTRTSSRYRSTVICVMLYVPGTDRVFTPVISPINNTCDYCCCFAATAADAGDGALYWCCSIFTAAAAAPGAPATALYCWCAANIMLYACGILCLMRLWRKGSILLRTGNTIWKVKAKRVCRVRIKLSWKVKLMVKNVYIREPLSVKFPGKCNCLEIGIWDQPSSDNS